MTTTTTNICIIEIILNNIANDRVHVKISDFFQIGKLN